MNPYPKGTTSPIFGKTYDFILWLLDHTEKFPKSERFRLARRLEDTAFEFYELLIRATRTTKRKQAMLLDADLVLDRLRLAVFSAFSAISAVESPVCSGLSGLG